jgi:hypothetical protein
VFGLAGASTMRAGLDLAAWSCRAGGAARIAAWRCGARRRTAIRGPGRRLMFLPVRWFPGSGRDGARRGLLRWLLLLLLLLLLLRGAVGLLRVLGSGFG